MGLNQSSFEFLVPNIEKINGNQISVVPAIHKFAGVIPGFFL